MFVLQIVLYMPHLMIDRHKVILVDSGALFNPGRERVRSTASTVYLYRWGRCLYCRKYCTWPISWLTVTKSSWLTRVHCLILQQLETSKSLQNTATTVCNIYLSIFLFIHLSISICIDVVSHRKGRRSYILK